MSNTPQVVDIGAGLFARRYGRGSPWSIEYATRDTAGTLDYVMVAGCRRLAFEANPECMFTAAQLAAIAAFMEAQHE